MRGESASGGLARRFAPLLLGALAGLASAGCQETTPTMRPPVESTFQVKGMTRGGCEEAIKRALGQLPGVEQVRASHAQARAWVTHDPTRVKSEQLRQAIQKLGFGAALLKTTKAPQP